MIESFNGNLEVFLQGAFPLALLASYLAGVLVGLTPCVYPVIPIIVGFIGGRNHVTKFRAFLLSVFYVGGMAATYTALGALTALTGKLFGQIQSSPWTYLVVGNLCLIMGLSMMGCFKFNVMMPSFLLNPKWAKAGDLLGSFFLGATSGLLIGPCTTPVLVVLLTLVATGQSVAGGMILLFVFAFGMGTWMIFLGTFTAMIRRLPKSGRWVSAVQRSFGILLIAMAEFYLIRAGQYFI